MTKQDYIKIAAILREAKTVPADTAVLVIVHELARVLQADNAHFDSARFKAACGFGGS